MRQNTHVTHGHPTPGQSRSDVEAEAKTPTARPGTKQSSTIAIHQLRQQISHQTLTTSHIAKSQIIAMQESQEAVDRLTQQEAQLHQLTGMTKSLQQQLLQQPPTTRTQVHHLETPHESPSIHDDENPPFTNTNAPPCPPQEH